VNSTLARVLTIELEIEEE